MKTLKLKSVISLLMVSMLFISLGLFAQQGQAKPMRMKQGSMQVNKANGQRQQSMNSIPNLTDVQKKNIQTLRTDMMKQMLPLRSLLKEKKAHLNTMSIATKVDQNAINKQIDDIAKLEAKIMKLRAQFRQKMRATLTDEQRVYFDAHFNQMMNRHHQGGMKAMNGMKGHRMHNNRMNQNR